MRLVLALFFLVVLIPSAFAALERASTGPYNVSFEMNTTMNYTVKEEPIYSDPVYSLYRLSIATNNSTMADIGIVEYANITDATLTVSKNFETLRMGTVRGYNLNIAATDMTIDGKKGFVIRGINQYGQRLFHSLYWLDSQDCECGPVSVGTITIGILSSYPSEITKRLLETLHVERKGVHRPRLGNLF